MTRTRLLLLAVLLGGALVLFAALSYFSAAHRVAYRADDPSYNRAYWVQQAKREGPAAAYKEFLTRAAALPEKQQHFAAHVIGAAIGEAAGAEGVKACDASFGFGCYHGLFAQVISTGGTDLVRTLDAVCVSAYGPLGTGCQHGIGHGILEYVGYEHIDKALALCKETTQVVPLLGCTSGVFMEYFFPLTGPADALVPSTRPLDPAHPFAPCTEVPVENQASCYYEFGSYLRTSAPDAAAAGKTCRALSGAPRTNCMLGIGTLSLQLDGNDMGKALGECATLAPADALSCRAGVRWGVFELPDRRADANAACADSDAARVRACETLGDLTQGHDAN